jgi:hypothetical protein
VFDLWTYFGLSAYAWYAILWAGLFVYWKVTWWLLTSGNIQKLGENGRYALFMVGLILVLEVFDMIQPFLGPWLSLLALAGIIWGIVAGVKWAEDARVLKAEEKILNAVEKEGAE